MPATRRERTLIGKTSLLRIVPMACGQAANKGAAHEWHQDDAVTRDARSLRTVVTLHHDRLSERSYLFTMSDITRPHEASRLHDGHEFDFSANELSMQPPGGARRDRTDDLMLAKHALSQLSYGPISGKGARGQVEKRWWAWEDLNFRPHAYQARALTN
jgi:hypothetical protein